MSNQHVLKIHPAPLADLLSGAKTAEVRRNDRGFQVGDTVRLMEVNPETGNWTGGADHVRTISHIQTGYGLPDGMCVLSYHQPFVPRNRLPGRLAIRAALPDVPGDMLDHGLFAALDAMGDQAEQQEAQGAQAGDERELFNRAYEEICNRPITIREIARRMWMARAALATQPAAYVLTKDGEIYWEGDDGIVISNTTGDCLDESYEWRPVGFISQPAVRGAEHE